MYRPGSGFIKFDPSMALQRKQDTPKVMSLKKGAAHEMCYLYAGKLKFLGHFDFKTWRLLLCKRFPSRSTSSFSLTARRYGRGRKAWAKAEGRKKSIRELTQQIWKERCNYTCVIREKLSLIWPFSGAFAWCKCALKTLAHVIKYL
jgi:hypothetical protein